MTPNLARMQRTDAATLRATFAAACGRLIAVETGDELIYGVLRGGGHHVGHPTLVLRLQHPDIADWSHGDTAYVEVDDHSRLHIR